nr:aldo/keto reductase [Nocardia niigatensis]
MEALRPIAAAHGTTVGSVAIAWTLTRPGVTGAIVGARRPEQVGSGAWVRGFDRRRCWWARSWSPRGRCCIWPPPPLIRCSSSVPPRWSR